jgi:branched-chain amino acid transport system ATP-binding protein
MPVLRDVTLKVYPAEIVALVGSNGAGRRYAMKA